MSCSIHVSNRTHRAGRLWLALGLLGGLVGASSAAALSGGRPAPAKASAAVEELFEAKVRPVLVEQCGSCHGATLQQSGLRLDSPEALLKGGKRGPALVKGDPERSLLIQSLRHTGPLKMPPTGKLKEAEIQAIAEWVRLGAPWPQGARKPAPGATSRHWAFLPVRKPAVPKVKNQAWVRTPIDAFVLARLEAKGLSPAPPADRRTLIRRAYFDLTGLPPTYEEVEAFVNDRSPDAWEKVVDRLLASPHYGERWGRYWLDMARYADTKGYVYTGERRYPFAYTYRDYVVRAFNEDLPYDRFLREQLAADQLDLGDDKRALAAMGFLTLGRRFVNMQPDIIDDRIDVVFRSTQGLTVSCARCHDHKFDPIPTADYYSLYGVFAGSTEKTVQIANPEPTDAYRQYEAELRKRQAAFDTALEKHTAELSERLRTRVEDYLAMVPEAAKLPGEEFYVIMGADDVNPILVRSWRAYVDRFRDGMHPVFGPWHAFERLPKDELASRAPALARELASNTASRLNPRVAALFQGAPPKSMEEVARRYGRLLAEMTGKWRTLVKTAAESKSPAPTALLDADEEALRQVLYAADSPASIPKLRISEVEYYFDEKTRNELNELQAQIDRWYLQSPATPPHALAMEDLPMQHDPRIFVRGNPSTKGEAVPRQFLAVLSGPDRKPFRQGSGRLELAQAITSRDNPLTARVMVNRVWLGHFGRGLVDTPSDFGLRSEPPSHPELLDYLAYLFAQPSDSDGRDGTERRRDRATAGVRTIALREAETAPRAQLSPSLPRSVSPSPSQGLGWSVKGLHRLMLLSSTYMQSSNGLPKTVAADPQNRLVGRMDRRRLDFEALRDSLLFVSGRLDTRLGGPSVDLFSRPFSQRRSVYAMIDRQNLPGLLRVFDFANPDRHSPQRYETTSPQQALFMLNSPFVAEQAKQLLARPGVTEGAPAAERVRQLYRLVYGRIPKPEELALALDFLGGATDAEVESPWRYGWGSLREDGGQVQAFHEFGHFSGEAWQGGPAWPDAATGWAQLSAAGGHAGNDAAHAVIRRWVSPLDGVITISGKVAHGNKEGDGVRARIVSSRHGLLGTWEVHNGSADAKAERVEVRKGDVLDFVVDCRGSVSYDDFTWAPQVRTAEAQWSAAEQFAGPALNAWEQYVQSLLLANEFVFVD